MMAQKLWCMLIFTSLFQAGCVTFSEPLPSSNLEENPCERNVSEQQAPSIIKTQNPTTTVNGCGSGWNVWVVPDSIPILNCQFRDACNKHDICYGKCEGSNAPECAYLRCKSGGDLYGSDQCRTDLALLRSWTDSQARKATCDHNLGDTIVSANPGRFVCGALGIVYRKAVKEWGGSAFSGLGDGQTIEAWRQPKDEYDKAIRDFFRLATPEQFEDFIRSQNSSNPKVKFNHPLRFDPERGLVNIRISNVPPN